MARKKSLEREQNHAGEHSGVTYLNGMYEDYFLDYASYVILERAVPDLKDGLKPVQRRLLHAMNEINDGRFHKVANIIGQTMQFHPHGDAAIGDALVNLGQKDLLIDTQGNWGDLRTGDSAAAARYIEARLTKFALEVAINPQTTPWQVSYDGRRNEPITLPVKFPLVLAQGVDGIAVGLATKILPHNFIELIQASIKVLEGKRYKLYPDFQTGGLIDVDDYQGGMRGGKVRVRVRIEKLDKSNLVIREIPYGVTTVALMDSIVKASEKGQIKVKKLSDNTAAEVEITIELQPGVSPDQTIDALYAFTQCEVSISPNACVISDNKPVFLTVDEILRLSTFNTQELLRQELNIRLGELEEKWHFSSLEKIFIEKRIYHDIEESETWENVLHMIRVGLAKYISTPATKTKTDKRLVLHRDITEEDITRLTEIRIKRISKYNSFQADELITNIEKELAQVRHDLKHLTEYTISYFQKLLDKYGKGKERKTEITTFDTIQATKVIANNAKLYVDRKEGFIGYGLKKDEFVADCSEIDDVIAFRKDGKFVVSKIADKVFVGKNIIHVNVFKRGDERTTYHLIYLDGASGKSYAKRFNVTSITRDKEYDLTKGDKESKVLFFSVHPNGESERVEIQLTPGSKARNKIFDFYFEELAIKGRNAGGNIVTRYPVRKITQVEVGKSTLGSQKYWYDEVNGRFNKDERGKYLGSFDTGDQLLLIYGDGSYEIAEFDPSAKIDIKDLMYAGKFKPKAAVSAIYFEGEKQWTMVKRFLIETTSTGQRFRFTTEHKDSKLYWASLEEDPTVEYGYMSQRQKVNEIVQPAEFIEVKGWKALGNKLVDKKLISIKDQSASDTSKETPDDEDPDAGEETKPTKAIQAELFKAPQKKDIKSKTPEKPVKKSGKNGKGDGYLHAGDTIEFDF
ncbi:MAG: DNA gyrase/topoisomerase IV subunit A [Saprospiraceae bacterium]|uniref:DNA gyrase/topoisomerase IV subunit A n=1 Tax=Candidatus Opimibacter skivensis TaxID=2982028 RepID=A0A9D7XPU9_9BACT|nr:DNA gyrase/topoisomerase IV subunit A [Candidatus Opimibacter skivensis]